ncbi:MAG: helix-turn-helix domain-containing protein [Caldilineaceae bacterium]
MGNALVALNDTFIISFTKDLSILDLLMSLPRAVIRHVLSTPMSLADLQQATQVSLPTLRRAVQDLTDARWIRVVGQAEANGGRPAMLFGADTTRFLLVGCICNCRACA